MADVLTILYANRRITSLGCWEWVGATNKGGYGQFTNQWGDTVHRRSWIAHKGSIPKGLFVLHDCDNRLCFNPDCLFLGTHQDNMDDMVAKGRSPKGARNGSRKYPERRPRGKQHWTQCKPERVARGNRSGSHRHPERLPSGDNHWKRKYPEKVARGEFHGRAILRISDVSQIKQLKHSGMTLKAIATKFGVSLGAITGIIYGKTWRHLLEQNQ